MATKDITDQQVLQAYKDAWDIKRPSWALDLLQERTGQHPKVCLRAAERCVGRNLLDYGVGIYCAWLTQEGHQLLLQARQADTTNPGTVRTFVLITPGAPS